MTPEQETQSVGPVRHRAPKDVRIRRTFKAALNGATHLQDWPEEDYWRFIPAEDLAHLVDVYEQTAARLRRIARS